MKFNINNNTGSPIEYENEINSLCDFAQKRIGFDKAPSIFVNHDKRNAGNTLAKTGYYVPDTMEIHVFATGRHPKDILRSIAHELVHHGQHMRGELDMEGYSGKGYAQKNPKLRQAEMEANDPMLFRDWEDSLKEKENTIYNERRNRKMSIKDWKNKELSENISRKWGFTMNLDNLSESKKKKPDEDGDGVPDWADKKPGKDDHADADEKDDAGDDEKSEKKPDRDHGRDKFQKKKKDEDEKEKVEETSAAGAGASEGYSGTRRQK